MLCLMCAVIVHFVFYPLNLRSVSQLLHVLGASGFLVPAAGSGSCVSPSVVVLLEGLEKASSLTGLLGDLCHSLDNRGSASPLALSTGTHSSHIGLLRN